MLGPLFNKLQYCGIFKNRLFYRTPPQHCLEAISLRMFFSHQQFPGYELIILERKIKVKYKKSGKNISTLERNIV